MIPVAAAATALGYSALFNGGAVPVIWAVSLVVLGLGGATFALYHSAREASSRAEQIAVYAAFLLCGYAVIQLLPLPLSVLRVIDPTRAEVADSLRRLLPDLGFSPLTVDQGKTSLRASWIVGQVLTFLLIREATLRTLANWAVAAPLVALGAVEAVVGIVQHASGAGEVFGTSDNKNHLSGILEMTLPLAAMYGVCSLRRSNLAFAEGLRGVVSITVAAAMLLGIVLTLSKMGFISALASLFVMGAIAVVSRCRGRIRWMAVALLTAALLTLLVFLPTNELVQAFGQASADSSAEGRIPIARDTLHLIRAYPVFGSGLGTYYPAFLRYQSHAPGLAWLSSHNDYLDFISELGLLGGSVLATFVCAVLACAVKAAVSGATPDTRLLSLGCCAGLVAILIHGFADFNMHIPANAAIFAWIAGIAVAAPLARAEPQRPAFRLAGARTFLVLGGLCAVLYGGAWLVYSSRFENNLDAERRFCRFGICGIYQAPFVLRQQHGGEIASVPPERILEYLRRDPTGPYRWADIGESFQKAGRTSEARYSFERAVALSPRLPGTLFRAAQFYARLGESQSAMALAVRALEADPENGSAFDYYDSWGVSLDDVLRSGLPPRPDVWRFFLRRKMQSGVTDDAAAVWSRMLARQRYVDEVLARDYVNYLVSNKRYEAAAIAWAASTAHRADEGVQSERLFNGGFESEFESVPFDWTIDARPGTTVDVATGIRRSGGRALRLRFGGRDNVAEIGVREDVLLSADQYRFRGYVRVEDVSTDQGIFFRLRYEVKSELREVVTDAARGTMDWTMLERVFEIPPNAGLVTVSLARKPSLKFDNLLRGTAWIDDVSITPATQDRPK